MKLIFFVIKFIVISDRAISEKKLKKHKFYDWAG